MKPTRKSPVTAKKYDVGYGEMLTVREIANVLGTSYGVVRARITKGWTGEQLLTPVGDRRRKSVPRTKTSVMAYTLALKFGRRVPTTKEIMDTYPMAESTAMYWRNAIKIALEKLPPTTSKYYR